jgi:hypothetical protein
MVRALLDGRKTKTRRVISKPTPTSFPDWFHRGEFDSDLDTLVMRDAQGVGRGTWPRRSPYGSPGDRLWVRESFRFGRGYDGLPPGAVPRENSRIHYDADGIAGDWAGKGRPSIHMPHRWSRIKLHITGVRVERLQDITEEDAFAEGTPGAWVDGADGWRRNKNYPAHPNLPTFFFRKLWEEINGPESWFANPWVWVIEFRRLLPGELARERFEDLQEFAKSTPFDKEKLQCLPTT